MKMKINSTNFRKPRAVIMLGSLSYPLFDYGMPIPGTRAGFVSAVKIDDFESLRHIRVVRRGPLDQDQVIPRNALRRHPLLRP